MNMQKFNAIFSKVDEVFVTVDRFFKALDDEPEQKNAPASTTTEHTYHADFRARTRKERVKLSLRFIRMSVAMLFKGRAQISYKNRANK